VAVHLSLALFPRRYPES